MRTLGRFLIPLTVIVGALVVVCARLLHQEIGRVALPVVLVVLLVLAALWWDVIRPLSAIIRWMRRFRFGEPDAPWALPRKGFLAPLAREARHMAQGLVAARAAAAEEARLRNAGESRWTPDRLREHVRTALKGRPLVVVSNREPYMHVRRDRQIRYLTPPGGLVTAMEPVLRACSGTWIAAGTGEADRDTADAHGRLRVPPEAPVYTLRRVWLTPEEEQGHYYGFANEGLWPLCHIAHTRPVFRADDWNQYVRVNEKFAEAVFEEIADTEEPCLIVQDYHLALLPRLVKNKRPDAKIALFWHIP